MINGYKFITSTVSKDVKRAFMLFPYYDERAKALISTNGRTLHIWRNPPIGDIAVSAPVLITSKRIVIDSTTKGDFVNWRKVVPEDTDLTPPQDFDFSNIDTATARFALWCGRALDSRLVAALQGGVWAVRFVKGRGKLRPVVFQQGDFTAIIQPLNLVERQAVE